MMRHWGLGLAWLLLASWGVLAHAAQSMVLAKGARVGIMNVMERDLTHIHMARELQDSFLKTQYVPWRIDTLLLNAVRERMQELGLTPVPVAPSPAISRGIEDCFVNASLSRGLPKECGPPFAEVAATEHLDAIMVLGPGVNDSNHGKRRKELPKYLRGWGFVTGPPDGAKPSLFNMTELLLIEITDKGARMGAREWGGTYTLEWGSFGAQPDLREMPPDEIEKLVPLFGDILTRQCDHLLEQIQIR